LTSISGFPQKTPSSPRPRLRRGLPPHGAVAQQRGEEMRSLPVYGEGGAKRRVGFRTRSCGNPDTLFEPSLPRRARSNVNDHNAKARSGGPRPSGHPTRAQSPQPALLPDSLVKQPRRPAGRDPSPGGSCLHEPPGQGRRTCASNRNHTFGKDDLYNRPVDSLSSATPQSSNHRQARKTAGDADHAFGPGESGLTARNHHSGHTASRRNFLTGGFRLARTPCHPASRLLAYRWFQSFLSSSCGRLPRI
jgi:hypothetical protein